MTPAPALPPVQKHEWQTIESVPKDAEIIAGFFGKPSGKFYYEIARWSEHDGVLYARNGMRSYASHWQPLPEPPAVSS